jgi:hypothetical protein
MSVIIWVTLPIFSTALTRSPTIFSEMRASSTAAVQT